MIIPKRTKILFWPGWWYPDRQDPLKGVFVRRHAEAVAPWVDLAVLYVIADPAMRGPAVELASDDQDGWPTVRVYHRPLAKPFQRSKALQAWRYFRAARRGIGELRSRWGEPDIIHLHVNPPWGQVASLRAFFPRQPFIFSEHWSGYHEASGGYRGCFRRWLTSWVTRRAAAVAPVSRDLQARMMAHGLRGRFTVIPNAIRADVFHPPDATPVIAPFTFLHVSCLLPLKNVAGILRAAASLRRQRQDFRLVIIGDGPDKPSLEKLTLELCPGEDGWISFYGRQDEAGVARTMRQASCLVLFSDYENLPCVVCEALASGLPVIATRVGGLPEQVGEGMGILVEPRDEAGLKQAMADILGGKLRLDRAAIRRRAVERYGMPVVGVSIARLYRQALGQEEGPT